PLLLMAGLAHMGLGSNARAREYLELYSKQAPDRAGAEAMARLHLSERDTEKAIFTLESYLRGRTPDPQTLALLSSARLAAGRPAQATQLMREALRGQDSPAFHALLGMSLQQQGQSAEAEAAFKRALQKAPNEPMALTALAELYVGSGRAALVPALLAPAMKANPGRDMARYQVLLGRARMALGELPAARTAFEAALAQDGGLSSARLHLARALALSGDGAGASRLLEAMVARDEQPVDAALELADLALAAGKPEAVRQWLLKAVGKSVAPDSRAGVALVEFLVRQGDAAAAAEQAKRLLAQSPDDFALLIASARVALAQRDGPGAVRPLVLAGRSARGDAGKLWLVARLQMNAGDLKGAAYTLEKALSEQDKLLPLNLLHVELALREGNGALAAQRLEPLLKRYPADPRVHSLAGQVALSRQQPAQAVAAFRRAHELAPSSETVLRLHGAMLGQVGVNQSLALLDQWLAKHPSDAVVRNALAEAQVATGQLAAARANYETLLTQTQSNAVRNNLASVLLRQKDPRALQVAEQALVLEPARDAPLVLI
ncbi:MAG TPA: tetratricopeptide repeat protein, partial [Burkholderiaceae bacterium]|nr:tetratricopeptide repeat protein [Burkholderiaceae bacterium]